MRRHIVSLAVVLTACPLASAQVTVWDKLMNRAQMESERPITRMMALSIACAQADEAQATTMLSMLSQWTEAVEQGGTETPDSAEAEAHSARRSLLAHVVHHGAESLNATGDHAISLHLWLRLSMQSWLSQDAKEKTFDLIAGNPGAVAARQEAAIAALRDSGVGRSGRMPRAFVPLLDHSTIPALRALVRESTDVQGFNYTTAATLAEFGDMDTLSELHALQAPFATADVCSSDALAWYAWQIEIQNPPSQLLTHIASGELFTAESRCWAIRKAAKHGLPAEDIRQAIESYGAVGRPFGPERRAAGIDEMKAVAMQLGILSDADMAGVAATPPTVEPHQGQWELSTPVVDWIPPWEPRYENYDAFFEWSQTIGWESLSDDEGMTMFRQKLCELELIPPQACGTVSDSADSPIP